MTRRGTLSLPAGNGPEVDQAQEQARSGGARLSRSQRSLSGMPVPRDLLRTRGGQTEVVVPAGGTAAFLQRMQADEAKEIYRQRSGVAEFPYNIQLWIRLLGRREQ